MSLWVFVVGLPLLALMTYRAFEAGKEFGPARQPILAALWLIEGASIIVAVTIRTGVLILLPVSVMLVVLLATFLLVRKWRAG